MSISFIQVIPNLDIGNEYLILKNGSIAIFEEDKVILYELKTKSHKEYTIATNIYDIKKIIEFDDTTWIFKATCDFDVKLLKINEQEMKVNFQKLPIKFKDVVNDIIKLSNNRLGVFSYDGQFYIIDMKEMIIKHSLYFENRNMMTFFEFSNKELLLAISSEPDFIQIWNLKTYQCETYIINNGLTGSIIEVVPINDRKVMLCTNRRIYIFDMSNQYTFERVFMLNKTELHKVIELREGKYLLGCEDTYEIFDSKVRKIVKLKKDKHWKSNCRDFYKINDKLILIIFNDYTFGGKSISLWKYTV